MIHSFQANAKLGTVDLQDSHKMCTCFFIADIVQTNYTL